jgi:hypothetical protein
VSHKEDRFLTPLVPLINAYAAIVTSSATNPPCWSIIFGIASMAVGSIFLGLYLSVVHQGAPEQTMHFLRNYLLTIPHNRATLHVLTSCYSTPGASFLHGVSVDGFMLECDPRFSELGLDVVSASGKFEQAPFSLVSSLYADIDLPDFAITWSSQSAKSKLYYLLFYYDLLLRICNAFILHVLTHTLQGDVEDVQFYRWMQEHFHVIHSSFHGHYPTFGSESMLLWEINGRICT